MSGLIQASPSPHWDPQRPSQGGLGWSPVATCHVVHNELLC